MEELLISYKTSKNLAREDVTENENGDEDVHRISLH